MPYCGACGFAFPSPAAPELPHSEAKEPVPPNELPVVPRSQSISEPLPSPDRQPDKPGAQSLGSRPAEPDFPSRLIVGKNPAPSSPKAASPACGCLVLLALVVIVVVAIRWVTSSASTGSSPTSAACDAAFANNETQLPGGKSSEFLDSAISACQSVADWQAAWAKTPSAHGSALEPIPYLTGRCVDFPTTALCKELTAVPAVSLSGAFDPPKSSAIEGVPIPQTAREEPSLAADGIGAYRVPAATFDELRAWYEQELPEGKPFGQWTWCEKFVSSDISQKTYAKPGTTQILSVVVGTGSPPGIDIGVDDSGPC